MTGSDASSPDPRDYLCVEAFIATLIDARALASAFETGLIDYLKQGRPGDLPSLTRALGIDGPALALLLDLLRANQVVEQAGTGIRLTGGFAKALRYRDLLETKLEWTSFVLADFAEGFTTLVQRPDRFRQSARLYDLFAYDSATAYSPRSLSRTRRWMRITTCLTKYEAAVCMAHHDFGAYERIMDVGGNSGELVLQICKRHQGIRATVFDLPVVCDIGAAHVAPHPEARRINFVKGDAFADDLPSGFDLMVFKSMLHDWPDAAVAQVLAKAARCLNEPGAILIFERGPLHFKQGPPSYAMIPFLLFFRSFRSPARYAQHLGRLGFDRIDIRWIDLEVPFFLLVARRDGDCALAQHP